MAPPSAQHSNVEFDEESRTFHDFPRLPVELRTMIWEIDIYTPRIITVHRDKRLTPTIVKGRQTHKAPCAMVGYIDAVPPVTLHISREARHLALKCYQQAFKGRLRRPIYFNFAVDYLHFQDGHAISVFEHPRADHKWGPYDKLETRQKVQRVVVGAPAFDRYESYSRHESYAQTVRHNIGRYLALKNLLFEAPTKNVADTGSVQRSLEKILKPMRIRWGALIPENIESVSSITLGSMIEGTFMDFDEGNHGELVVRNSENVDGEDNTESTCGKVGDDGSDGESDYPVDESSDEEE